jgi:hypothetical protein
MEGGVWKDGLGKVVGGREDSKLSWNSRRRLDWPEKWRMNIPNLVWMAIRRVNYY